ncbi:hypothetical protein [uncultured Gimesia sp.]|uniref:hypothetical protein n=1 Tax=uncultured Gimesia sp. TaxID=1678688 RepID=UPI0030D8053E|tara:strand:+ start:203011 stop:204702 length:1692 start_codon:yes stop_codon:yes gene_type:complete
MTVQDLPPQFNQLLNQLIDNQLSDVEFEELEQCLSENPEARQIYFDYLDINSGIQENNVDRLKQLDQIVTANSTQNISVSQQAEGKRRGNQSPLFGYFSAAAASVALLISAHWFLTGHMIGIEPPQPQPEQIIVEVPVEVSAKNIPYVATLSRATDCKWGGENPPQFSGQRLLSKELFLERGVAEFRFDNGVRLVLEGPTKINIESANCATIASGSVVLHGYESSPEFELITPQASFFDIGTEYGTKVEEDGSTELHVFQGAVRVEPEMKLVEISAPLIVGEGKARHINQKVNEEIELKSDDFKHEVPGKPKELRVVRDEVIAYDSFHPLTISDPKEFSEWRRSGFGWTTHWRNRVDSLKPASGNSIPEETLLPDLLSPNQMGCVELERGKIAWRTLEKPLRLDTDAIYYISFFIQKSVKQQSSSHQYGNLSLMSEGQPENENRILFGINSNSYPTLQLKGQNEEIAPALLHDQPYFFVGKIVASENSSDQVFLRAFSKEETIPNQEPLVWTCRSTPFDESTTYDLIRIHAGKSSQYRFDELRIGTSWESVVDFHDPDDMGEE